MSSLSIRYSIGHSLGFFCRFVKDVLHFRKRKKHGLRWHPVERSHREIIILPLSYSKLFLKVSKGIKLVRSIEFFIILAMATLHLAIVSGCKRADQFVWDLHLWKCFFKKSLLSCSLWIQPICKLKSVIRLYTLNLKWELFNNMKKKLRRRISVMLLKRL